MLETRVPGLLQLIPVIDLGLGIDRIELLALPLGSTCIIEAAVFGATIPANPETFFIATTKSEKRSCETGLVVEGLTSENRDTL